MIRDSLGDSSSNEPNISWYWRLSDFAESYLRLASQVVDRRPKSRAISAENWDNRSKDSWRPCISCRRYGERGDLGWQLRGVDPTTKRAGSHPLRRLAYLLHGPNCAARDGVADDRYRTRRQY